MKKLEATSSLIAKSIKESNWLQLDEDGKHVRRRVGIGTSVKNDQCTVYIEGLPADATISWMKQVCVKLGKVKHIYLPKFKNCDVLKGFAFVEFEQKEEAYRACNILNSPPPNFFPNRTSSYLSSLALRNHVADNFPDKQKDIVNSDEKDNNLSKTSSRLTNVVPNLQKLDVHAQKTNSEESDAMDINKQDILKEPGDNNTEPSNYKDIAAEKLVIANHSKYSKGRLASVVTQNSRKRCMSEPSNNHIQPKLKKLDENGSTCKPNHILDNNHITSGKDFTLNASTNQCVQSQLLDVDNAVTYGRFLASKAITQTESKLRHCSSHPDFAALRQDQPTVLSSVVTVPKNGKGASKKTRRKKNKTVKQPKTNQCPPNIKAMPKIAWLELKKSYQHKQREEMGKIKSILQHNSFKDGNTQSTFIKRHLVLEEHVSFEEMSPCNEVINTSLESAGESPGQHNGKRGQTSFQPGVIIQVQNYKLDPLQNISASVKLLKQHFSLYGPVAYVDIQQDLPCYVRFGNAKAAQQAVLEEQDYSLCLLTGAVEESYWDSLLASRQLKRSRERPKVRGREKIAMKAVQLTCQNSKQHIKFNHNY
uniref:La-related protein 7-like n=1 Tax=Phallusia mammillata TaxID=59560 RepID=A0A6F9DIZ3_9ASCI|nr:la-related protein 7-like [Phallusia mammillata]